MTVEKLRLNISSMRLAFSVTVLCSNPFPSFSALTSNGLPLGFFPSIFWTKPHTFVGSLFSSRLERWDCHDCFLAEVMCLFFKTWALCQATFFSSDRGCLFHFLEPFSPDVRQRYKHCSTMVGRVLGETWALDLFFETLVAHLKDHNIESWVCLFRGFYTGEGDILKIFALARFSLE